MHGFRLNFAIHMLFLPHVEDGPNTFTGFQNIGNTCFVNAVLQAFLHVSALRAWISEPTPYAQDVHDKPKLSRLQEALKKVLQWHSSNEFREIVPIDLLQCLFDLGTDRYGMIAGCQFDALECFTLFHHALGSPNNDACWFFDQHLQYPSGFDENVHIGISLVLNQMATLKGLIRNSAPATLALSVLPFRLHTETKAEWINLAISEWDAAIDLSPFFNRTQPIGEYYVKAVIYHVHPAAGPVDLNSGHYVAYVKQAQQWHLANDNKVSPVLMSGLRGLPCLLVLERKDRPGADLPAKQVQQPAAEIPVPDLDEQPEASPSEHDGSSSETDATSSDHDSTPSERQKVNRISHLHLSALRLQAPAKSYQKNDYQIK